MHIPDDLRFLLIDILASNLFTQLAPLFVLFLIPALVFFAITSIQHSRSSMGFESLSAWLFSPGSKASSTSASTKSSSHDRHEKKKKKYIRTHAEQLSQNGRARHESSSEDEGYYPGLVNISGTYCFMNATLQALASLTYLQPHIDAIQAKAEALDVPTPVIDALKDLLHHLNQPSSSYRSIRPHEIIQVLSAQTEGRTNSLFYSREHQDAQELFQVISECIKNEITAVDKEAYRDRGLGALSNIPAETMRDIGKSVFDGLTANRRSCVYCGYTEAVMHFSLDNWQLALPRLVTVCRLEDCLEDYTRLEILKDCICRKCSVLATQKRLQHEILTLEHETRPDAKPSNSKKERLKRVRRMEARVRSAIEQDRIEDDLKDVRMEKIFSPASTKQSMIARPPPVLALHINRSLHYGHYASKNNVRLIFPEVLDLTPYTTSGNLSTVPTSAISTPPPALPRSATPTPTTYSNPRVIYRLAAVVCHFGQHSFGHYICYRRKPRHSSLNREERWVPPKLIDPLRLENESESENSSLNGGSSNAGEQDPDYMGTRYVFEDDAQIRPGKGWLRISDDAVRECGIETVLQEGVGAFMLYYERAVQEQAGVYASDHQSPRSSEETLKPELKTVKLNGSATSLVSEVGVGVKQTHTSTQQEREGRPMIGLSASLSQSQIPGARIVRSVATGQKRSRSANPRSRSASSASAPMAEMNGSAKLDYDGREKIDQDMSASLPMLPSSFSSIPNDITQIKPIIKMANGAKPSSAAQPSTASSSSSSSLPRIHSPRPQRPQKPNGIPAVVDLKA